MGSASFEENILFLSYNNEAKNIQKPLLVYHKPAKQESSIFGYLRKLG